MRDGVGYALAESPSTNQEWHTLGVEEAVATLKTSVSTGLTTSEASSRLEQYGPNELEEKGAKSPLAILWEQTTSLMILVLVGAALIKIFVALHKPDEWIDAGAIWAIVILNIALGFMQEYRAEKAMAALKKMSAPLVRVRRDGLISEIPSRHLVPGDIVLLEAGNTVPADLRVIESANLRAQEASLTGESLPVDKSSATLTDARAPLGDRTNLMFMGTSVTFGRATALVVRSGMKTELGKIAEMLQGVTSEATPLQKRIQQLGIALAVAILVVCLAMFALGLSKGKPALDMFMAAVAVAVAAIPEGLPAVMTVTLALGAQRMLKRGALIRRLPAVETLGSVTVICSDKTGTLTENRMQVVALDASGHRVNLTEVVKRGHPVLDPADIPENLTQPEHTILLGAGSLCNDAFMQKNEQSEDEYTAVGDPTEGAILIGAAHYNIWKHRIDEAFPRRAEAPFSSERKRMTTIHSFYEPALDDYVEERLKELFGDAPYLAITKGSADGMMDICVSVLVNGRETPLTHEKRTEIEQSVNSLAQQGLRVLGLGYKTLDTLPPDGKGIEVENNLTFVGLIGMIDPPRAEVKDAVERCLMAGIRPMMITGDHPLTAMEIARQLKIAPAEGGRILTGKDLAEMSSETLQEEVEKVCVFARVSPEHKLKIVEALQRRGHVVAMTGDGVNDAPALRKSDIGVAMGITGTDVSKEAAEMVITDDNFATIVRAVEEGRTIYDNVRKFVKYIVTSNSAEVAVMFVTQLLGMPLPMTTLQILWMNLVTDGVPGLALGLEPTEKDTMQRKPFSPGESIFSRGIGRHIILFGMLLAVCSFGVGYWGYISFGEAGPWGTMVFVTLTLAQMGHAMAVRSNKESLFKIGLGGNKVMLGAVVVTVTLQMLIVYLPPLQWLFKTQPLTAQQLAVCLIASTVMFWGVEFEKMILRRKSRPEGITVA